MVIGKPAKAVVKTLFRVLTIPWIVGNTGGSTFCVTDAVALVDTANPDGRAVSVPAA